jgi:iron(III) transport system ATP-binding protein
MLYDFGMPNSVADVVAPPRVAVVEVTGVRKAFGDATVLDGLDLVVEPGSVVALLGPSGCGKTTLLRSIAGLEAPESGEIRLNGRTVTGPGVFVPAERRNVGMVFQDWALFPHLSVGRNVGFGLSRAERRSGRVEEALRLVDLAGFADRDPTRLSGGQRQRVALARALATRPSVLLLDEPFSNLDASLRVQVRAEVHQLLTDLGITAVFVTHDQEEAFVVGDRVAVMLDGRIAQYGPPARVYAEPASWAVARFVGDPNLLPGVAGGTGAETAVGVIPLTAELRGDVRVLVRPEQLRLCQGDGATVEAVEYYGHDAIYQVRPDGGPPVRVRVLDAPIFGPGDRVALSYAGGPTVGFASS